MLLTSCKFLLDENIDVSILHYLQSLNYSVFDIKEERLFGISDKMILQYSYENKCVIISQDSDFGELIFREHFPFYGIIFLKPGHFDPQVHIQSLKAILKIEMELDFPFLIIAHNNGNSIKVRYRSF